MHSAGTNIYECQQNSRCCIAERVDISWDPSDMQSVREVTGCFGCNHFHFLAKHITVVGSALFLALEDII
jgi:hypothetical protein